MTLEQMTSIFVRPSPNTHSSIMLYLLDCFNFFLLSKDLAPVRMFSNLINPLLVPPRLWDVRDISNKVPKSLHFLTWSIRNASLFTFVSYHIFRWCYFCVITKRLTEISWHWHMKRTIKNKLLSWDFMSTTVLLIIYSTK